MRLSLITDGTVGNTIGVADISDHPDATELQEGLDAIGEQAKKTLIDDPAAAAAAAQAAADAESGTTQATTTKSTSK
jgi:hypothetical protein